MIRWCAAVVLTVTLGACVQVLGIKDAERDPLRAKPASESAATNPAAAVCKNYCNLVMDACQGKLQQYATPEVCLAVCNMFDKGEPGAMSGNTANCRLTKVTAVKNSGEVADLATCAAAGPGGNGTCGSECEAYCALLQKACSADFHDFANDLAGCQTKCKAFPVVGVFEQSIRGGDSLECRLYHVTSAVLDAIHCGHAIGASICVKGGDENTGAGGSGAGGGGAGGAGGK